MRLRRADRARQARTRPATGSAKSSIMPSRSAAARPISDPRKGITESQATPRPRISKSSPIVKMVVGQGATPNIGPAIKAMAGPETKNGMDEHCVGDEAEPGHRPEIAPKPDRDTVARQRNYGEQNRLYNEHHSKDVRCRVYRGERQPMIANPGP